MNENKPTVDPYFYTQKIGSLIPQITIWVASSDELLSETRNAADPV